MFVSHLIAEARENGRWCSQFYSEWRQNGAPRPMKMGTIVSPWHYDAVGKDAKPFANLRAARHLPFAQATVILRSFAPSALGSRAAAIPRERRVGNHAPSTENRYLVSDLWAPQGGLRAPPPDDAEPEQAPGGSPTRR